MQREPIMNQAPAKELIPLIVHNPTLDNLRTFYRMRVEWKSYPIIHERLMSSSLFDDLIRALKEYPDHTSTLIDYALTLLETEDEQFILCAVFLLTCLCNSASAPMPSKDQIERISLLKSRVEDFSFIINLSSFWELIAQYAARYHSDLQSKLFFQASASIGLAQYQLGEQKKGNDCPVTLAQLNEWMNAFEDQFTLDYRATLAIEYHQYWIFRCSKKDNPTTRQFSGNHLWVHKDGKEKIRIFRRSISGIEDEALRSEILEFHFSPWEGGDYSSR